MVPASLPFPLLRRRFLKLFRFVVRDLGVATRDAVARLAQAGRPLRSPWQMKDVVVAIGVEYDILREGLSACRRPTALAARLLWNR